MPSISGMAIRHSSAMNGAWSGATAANKATEEYYKFRKLKDNIISYIDYHKKIKMHHNLNRVYLLKLPMPTTRLNMINYAKFNDATS